MILVHREKRLRWWRAVECRALVTKEGYRTWCPPPRTEILRTQRWNAQGSPPAWEWFQTALTEEEIATARALPDGWARFRRWFTGRDPRDVPPVARALGPG